MSRIIDTPKALLVEMPEGSEDFTFIQAESYLDSPKLENSILETDLPRQYSYGQPMLAEEMGEDEISEIVEYVVSPILRGYRDYDSLKGKEVIEAIVDTPCQSFASLLRSHNLKPETTVVIPKL